MYYRYRYRTSEKGLSGYQIKKYFPAPVAATPRRVLITIRHWQILE
jgi:hypothetical protein